MTERCILAAAVVLMLSLPVVVLINSERLPQPPSMSAADMIQRMNELANEHEPNSPAYYVAYYSALRAGDWMCVFCDVRTQELRWRYVGPARRKTWNVMEQRWQ